MEDVARRHGGRPDPGPGGGGADLISALPEDLLLQVLVRLGCARAAARTGLLPRRWRGMWTRLPDLVFRDLALGPLLPVLASLQAAAGVSLLDIRVAGLEREAALVSSLLHAAAGLSPAEFRLALPRDIQFFHVEMPRFHRATSIELTTHYLHLLLSRISRFPALQRLSLSGCRVDLADLVHRCPCLRVLRVASGFLDSNITIKSESLGELAAESLNKWTDCIYVEAPMLKKLAMSFSMDNELSVSIVAPIVEKVSWECSYSYSSLTRGLGPWSLSKLSLHAAESHEDMVLTDTRQLSNVYVLSLQIWPCGLTSYPDAEFSLEQEIETHLVTDFSVLELHFTTMGLDHRVRSVRHVFGAFVLHLLGMHPVRVATQKLKIILQRSEFKEECPVNCPCDEPKNWRSKNISLINLEEVEMEGFEGEDHEFDLLKVILRCAPTLKRMAVRMSDEVRTNNDRCSKIYDIFKACPFMECDVDLSSGSKRDSQSSALA